MSSSMFSSSYNEKSKARRELQLQGPRPSPLQLGKDSCKIIKKSHNNKRPPIIIYLKSPEIIHTKPQDFMFLVQELTGKPTTSTSRCGSSLSLMVEDYNTTTSNVTSPRDHDEGLKENNINGKEDLMAVVDRGMFSPSMMPLVPSPAGFPNFFLPSPNAYTSWLDYGPIY